MSECPHKLRSDLPPLTRRIAKLPVDERGYPVPFFVAWIGGKPEFRAADQEKHQRCLRDNLCWVCGEPLGSHKAFTIGPMCAINRTTSEPPEHLDCAEWSVRGCPFLAKPQMVRREIRDQELKESMIDQSGIPILRNPGVSCIWVTKSFKRFWAGNGYLIQIGEPESFTWWAEGRTATRAEVQESIRTGLPALMNEAVKQDEAENGRNHAVEALNASVTYFEKHYLPI